MRRQGRRCEPGRGRFAGRVAGGQRDRRVDFTCRGAVRDLLIRDDLFDVLGADYHTLARIDAPGRTAQFVFTPEARETRVSADAGGPRGLASFVLPRRRAHPDGLGPPAVPARLLLRGGGWWSLAKIITAFTVAHSVTLALAVLDVVVAAGPAGRGGHRPVDRLRRRREPLPPSRRRAALARQLLLRARPRVRLLVGAPRAGPARPRPRAVAASGSTSGSSSGRPWSSPWPCPRSMLLRTHALGAARDPERRRSRSCSSA